MGSSRNCVSDDDNDDDDDDGSDDDDDDSFTVSELGRTSLCLLFFCCLFLLFICCRLLKGSKSVISNCVKYS